MEVIGIGVRGFDPGDIDRRLDQQVRGAGGRVTEHDRRRERAFRGVPGDGIARAAGDSVGDEGHRLGDIADIAQAGVEDLEVDRLPGGVTEDGQVGAYLVAEGGAAGPSPDLTADDGGNQIGRVRSGHAPEEELRGDVHAELVVGWVDAPVRRVSGARRLGLCGWGGARHDGQHRYPHDQGMGRRRTCMPESVYDCSHGSGEVRETIG